MSCSLPLNNVSSFSKSILPIALSTFENVKNGAIEILHSISFTLENILKSAVYDRKTL